MQSEKRRKFNGKSYRVSNLKEGPYKKKLIKQSIFKGDVFLKNLVWMQELAPGT